MGRRKLEKETNIISIIKSRRYFNAAIKLLLTKHQRDRLKEHTKYLHINPEKYKSTGEGEEVTDS